MTNPKPPCKMTNEQLNCEIGRSVGWTGVHPHGITGVMVGHPPGSAEIDWPEPLPPWATTITFAWELVEMMSEDGHVSLTRPFSMARGRVWACRWQSFECPVESRTDACNVHMTRAICEVFVMMMRFNATGLRAQG